MTRKERFSALLLTVFLTGSSGVWALGDRGHKANWYQPVAEADLPKDWRQRLVVGKPMARPLLERAELVYQDAEQRLVTLRLEEVLVHVRKQDQQIIAVTSKM